MELCNYYVRFSVKLFIGISGDVSGNDEQAQAHQRSAGGIGSGQAGRIIDDRGEVRG